MEISLFNAREYFGSMVEEAVEKRQIHSSRGEQEYLITLLEHFLDARNLYDEPTVDEQTGLRKELSFSEIYLTAIQSEKSAQFELFKKLADRSLYISGFFGDSLNRKIIDVDFYVDLGGAAYANLSQISTERPMVEVYRTFSMRFVEFVDVLAYISHQSFIKSNEGILRLYDRYIKTGSGLAKDKLIELGVLNLDKALLKKSRQDKAS